MVVDGWVSKDDGLRVEELRGLLEVLSVTEMRIVDNVGWRR